MSHRGCDPPLPHPFRRLPRRSPRREILDEGDGVPVDALLRSLNAMSRVNRRLGGVRSLLAHLRPLLREHPRSELSILDLGVGLGDVPRALARTLEGDGVRVRWTGVDLDERVLGLARRASAGGGGPEREGGGERLVRADALRLPFPRGSFDVAISTLTLHHFADGRARIFLAEAARVSRLAVLVSDLERHPLHYLGARLLAATWWRADPITRCDGPTSVLRAYTRDEARALCEGLPLARFSLRRHLPFRLVIEARP
jgi:SAM-dependent methyltransferase